MDGFRTPAGRLARTSYGDTAFLYDADYVAAGGVPLSLALPVEEEAFGDVETRAFFPSSGPPSQLFRPGAWRFDFIGCRKAAAICLTPIEIFSWGRRRCSTSCFLSGPGKVKGNGLSAQFAMQALGSISYQSLLQARAIQPRI